MPGYLLMILNLSENNWKLFRSFFYIIFLCDNTGVPAKRPFFQYLLKVNNNKTTNELTRVRARSPVVVAVGKNKEGFFRISSLFLYS